MQTFLFSSFLLFSHYFFTSGYQYSFSCPCQEFPKNFYTSFLFLRPSFFCFIFPYILKGYYNEKFN